MQEHTTTSCMKLNKNLFKLVILISIGKKICFFAIDILIFKLYHRLSQPGFYKFVLSGVITFERKTA